MGDITPLGFLVHGLLLFIFSFVIVQMRPDKAESIANEHGNSPDAPTGQDLSGHQTNSLIS